MKTTVLTILVLTLAWQLHAVPSPFSYDHERVARIFAGLTVLEYYAELHHSAWIDASGTVPMEGLLPGESPDNNQTEHLLGIPGFWWGCVTNVIGVVLVGSILDNAKETQKAMWGCFFQDLTLVAVLLIIFNNADSGGGIDIGPIGGDFGGGGCAGGGYGGGCSLAYLKLLL